MAGRSDRFKADIVLLLVAAVWGGGFVAQRTGSQHVGFFVFGAARYFLGVISLLPFIRHLNIPRRWLPWSILTGVVLFAGSALQQAGITTTTAGNAAFITGLYVVIVPILLAIITRKPASGITWVAAIVAVFGTFLLSSGGTLNTFAFGDVLELIGAVMWACHLILVSKLSSKVELIQFSVMQYMVAGILNLIFGLAFEYRPSEIYRRSGRPLPMPVLSPRRWVLPVRYGDRGTPRPRTRRLSSRWKRYSRRLPGSFS